MTNRIEPFVFFRAEGFYIVEIPRGQVEENVRLNPGTLKVEDLRGVVIWQAEPAPPSKEALRDN